MPSRLNWKTIIGLLSGVVMFLFLLWAAHVVHGGVMRPAFALTFVLALFGVSLGWLVGLLASPYDNTELQRFAKYAGVLATFLTGYVAAKLDPVVEQALAKYPINVDDVTALRLTVFATSAIVGTIASYSYREYLFRPKPRSE